ncbi:MAG: iron ABC transporter permease [Oscillibacter sp.]|nr:iron ABC transporter permease [Oscillibacter sp.]
MNSWRTSCILKRPAGLCLLLALLTVLAALAGICAGSVPLSLRDVAETLRGRQTDTAAYRIVLYTRLPRVLAGLLAGAALAASGALLQAVLANSLASPGVIGVNAGAGLLVSLSCALFPASAWTVPLAAFLGAALGVLLVLSISEAAGASRISLALTGVAVSSVFSAGIDAVVTFFPDALNGYSDFRVGGLSGVTLPRLVPAAWVIGIALPAALSLAAQLDVLSLGSETAQSLGLPVRRTRVLLLLLAAALAGAAVGVSGLLGFVGLIAPQAVRRLQNGGGAFQLLASALGGALLLTLCDLLSRTLFSPYELPVGVVMSLLGGPFFIWLLYRQRGGRTHA